MSTLERYNFQRTIYDNVSESEELLDDLLAELKERIILHSKKRRGEIIVEVNLCYDPIFI